MKALRKTLERLAQSMALTIMSALSNHVSLCGRVIYPSTKDSSPASAPINRVCHHQHTSEPQDNLNLEQGKIPDNNCSAGPPDIQFADVCLA